MSPWRAGPRVRERPARQASVTDEGTGEDCPAMGQENGAPGRARTAPARTVRRYGLRWRARDTWRELRWRARHRPLYVIGLIWTALGAGMLLSTVLVPGLARYPAGPCITGVTALVLGTWACCVKGRWRR